MNRVERDYRDAQIVELYLNGWSTVGITTHFGLSDDTVYRALRRAGVRFGVRELPREDAV